MRQFFSFGAGGSHVQRRKTRITHVAEHRLGCRLQPEGYIENGEQCKAVEPDHACIAANALECALSRPSTGRLRRPSPFWFRAPLEKGRCPRQALQD